jgi:hypothetical protein
MKASGNVTKMVSLADAIGVVIELAPLLILVVHSAAQYVQGSKGF